MTVYSDIVSEIYTVTKRPDLVARTAMAVRKATFKFHLAEDWPRDLVTLAALVPATVSATDYTYQVDTSALPIERFKKLAYIRDAALPVRQFYKLEPNVLFDTFGTEVKDTYIVAGAIINLKASAAISSVDLGYYQLPDTAELTYSSWIASAYQDFIVAEAAAQIFKSIGKDDEAKIYASEFLTNLNLLQMAEIT